MLHQPAREQLEGQKLSTGEYPLLLELGWLKSDINSLPFGEDQLLSQLLAWKLVALGTEPPNGGRKMTRHGKEKVWGGSNELTLLLEKGEVTANIIRNLLTVVF